MRIRNHRIPSFARPAFRKAMAEITSDFGRCFHSFRGSYQQIPKIYRVLLLSYPAHRYYIESDHAELGWRRQIHHVVRCTEKTAEAHRSASI